MIISFAAGLHHVFTGNVLDTEGGTTFCPGCHAALFVCDWYDIRRYDLTPGTPLAALLDRLCRPLRQGARARRPDLWATASSGAPRRLSRHLISGFFRPSTATIGSSSPWTRSRAPRNQRLAAAAGLGPENTGRG